jgi:hypothetical protein
MLLYQISNVCCYFSLLPCLLQNFYLLCYLRSVAGRDDAAFLASCAWVAAQRTVNHDGMSMALVRDSERRMAAQRQMPGLPLRVGAIVLMQLEGTTATVVTTHGGATDICEPGSGIAKILSLVGSGGDPEMSVHYLGDKATENDAKCPYALYSLLYQGMEEGTAWTQTILKTTVCCIIDEEHWSGSGDSVRLPKMAG